MFLYILNAPPGLTQNKPINMQKILLTLFLAGLSLPLWAADGDTAEANKNHTVTMRMHDGGSFAISVGNEPVRIKIVPAESKTIGAIMLGDNDITSLLDADGNYAVGNAEAGEHNVNVVFEKNIPTGIDTVDSDLKDICVTVKNGTIYICGAPADVTAELYDLSGLCVYAGNDRTISVNSRGYSSFV